MLLHLFVLHVLFCSSFFIPSSNVFLCFFLLLAVLGRGVAVRGVILKDEKAGGGLGGRAQRLPPRCIGCCCICSMHVLFCSSFFIPSSNVFLCFFLLLAVLGRGVAVRGVILKDKKNWRGVGGGATPQMH